MTLRAGQPLEVETATPAGGAGEFVNLLDPVIRVYNASGNLVAFDDNSATDGRNARLRYNVPQGAGGTYYVEVASSSATPELTGGEYILSVKGNVAGASQGGTAGATAFGTAPLTNSGKTLAPTLRFLGAPGAVLPPSAPAPIVREVEDEFAFLIPVDADIVLESYGSVFSIGDQPKSAAPAALLAEAKITRGEDEEFDDLIS